MKTTFKKMIKRYNEGCTTEVIYLNFQSQQVNL